ncbi:hypothetical protein PHMEG_00020756 [Phytophthora megakarya]|uniref:Uncharacterized protein n=1 Tax=Phytophthora megakarya TaxID=4795 RepID=A0A225VNK2_9STRA|nr:hypothetical protein PHMEG_00020756 [Phytophthora megakarya]
MTPQARVGTMRRSERLRNHYRVTKVTINMLYAVNFGRRPIDNFLCSEESFDVVVHDDTHTDGPDTNPHAHIRRAEQSYHVLYIIQDAAAEWYPPDVAVPHQSGRSDQTPVIPAATRNQIPVVNGVQVSIRYQVERGCTFPR